ncbi:ABC transporter sub-family G-like protein 1 [Leptotrombidium deliense]|uniref:ABC transporter sub-family G-like protein 1 n=1 Tax=Leptotrombidium deliense TaxID=299467 RepID=A0A443SBJ5_9ACAR|nr:ABC transporter sub-family G-like protein 1 [Leptotrombidium deliense]
MQKSRIDVFIDQFVYQKQNTANTTKVLDNLCGQFKFGELSAVMGPSGAGKSIFLECITCRRDTGVNGFVGLNGIHKVKVSFIPHNDHFFSVLTVREALMFASKLQNTEKTNNEFKTDNTVYSDGNNYVAMKLSNFHENTVNLVLKQLSLESCADTRISNLSGGQIKRLSIAQELVSKPNILVLDEPTSGLDSCSCIQTVELLRSLTQQNQSMAIIASIHQPSAKVFNLFHRIYMLSNFGTCIYDGSPTDVIQWIHGFNLNIPQYYNPADFMIEVANEVYGNECIQQMSSTVTQNFKQSTNSDQCNLSRMKECLMHRKRNLFNRIKTLSVRSLLILFRDPLAFFFQVIIQILVAANIGLLFYGVGKSTGCPQLFPLTDDLKQIEVWKNETKKQGEMLQNNIGSFMFTVVICIFQGCCLNVVTFPLTIQVIKKEISNGWYTTMAYYAGYILADIPLQIINSAIFSTLVYLFTSQPLEFERYAFFAMFITVTACISQTHGIIFGLIFNKNITTAVLVSSSASAPFVLFGGFVIKPHTLPYFLEVVSRFSFFRYAFEGISVTMYGNFRCGYEVQQTFQKTTETLKSLFTVVCPNSLLSEAIYENNVTTNGKLFDAMLPLYFDESYDSNGHAVSSL